jgi:hypothetical protein
MATGGRAGVRGKSAIRKLLKALPDDARTEIAEVLEVGGRQILAAQRASARRRSGKLAAGLRMRFAKKSLSLKIGIVGKASARKLFYARILGGGRKAQTVQVRRQGAAPYALRVKSRDPEPVIDPPGAKAARRKVLSNLKEVWAKAIASHPPGGPNGD